MANVVEALTGGVAAVAIGEAGSAALDPVFEPVKQDAWKKKPSRIHDLNTLARLVAQALNSVDDVLDDAERNGYSRDELLSAIQLALTAPGPPDAEKLYLRKKADPPGAITLEQLHHAYAKAGIEFQYWDALTAAAQTTLLTPAQLALAVVRSTVSSTGLLVVDLDTSGSNVAQYPVAALDVLDEAAAAGYNAERLRVLVGAVGLPMGSEAAAKAQFRDIITKGAYYQAILEGDTRPEWADAIYDYARQIPTAHDAIEMRLRNYFQTDKEMYDQTARHGMSEADTDILFQVTGRPLGWHQTWIGLRRGGTLGGPIDQIDPAFLDSLRKSNIRPEYYNLAWAQRFSLPAIFMVRQWLKDGGDTTRAHDWLFQEGWNEDDIAAIIKEYAPSGGAAPSAHVKSAQTAVVTAAKKAFLAPGLTPLDASTQLQAAGLSAADAAAIIAQWTIIAQIEGVNIDTAGGTPH